MKHSIVTKNVDRIFNELKVKTIKLNTIKNRTFKHYFYLSTINMPWERNIFVAK